MNSDEYRRMYAVENSHWWYHNLHHLVLTQLRRYLPQTENRPPQILDAGCGTGAMAEQLSRLGVVTAMDFSPHALRFCHARHLPHLVAGSINALPFADAAFDAVVSLDVLCHTSVDEAQAVAELARVLRPGGLLLLNLPAFEWLRGRHDVAVHTARRYHRRRVGLLLERGGIAPVWMSHWNTLLFPAVAAVRLASRRQMARAAALQQRPDALPSDVQPVAPLVNRTLKGVLALERGLMTRTPLPFGVSLMALGRRKNGTAT